MRRLYYHQSYPGIWMLNLKDIKSDKEVTKDKVTILYSKDEIIGYNFSLMPELKGGYHPLDQEKLELINDILTLHNLPLLNEEINPLVIGRILACEKNGDVTICQVDIKEKTLQIVTKAQNVAVKQKVVVVLPGAVLYNGDIIEEGKVYNHLSQGVLGSRYSLFGKLEDRGFILELSQDAEVGKVFDSRVADSYC